MTRNDGQQILAGSTLPLPPVPPDNPELWSQSLQHLRRCGFEWVDVVDSWLPFGLLPSSEAPRLADALADADIQVAGLSAIRRSVIDPVSGDENLRYTHNAIELAAAIGAAVVSIGFHRPLTEVQQQWPFWAAPTPSDNLDTWELAVTRLRELALHAASVNVVLSLELYEETLLGSGAMAARLVQEADVPALGINADIANLYRVPRRLTESWVENLAASIPYLNYWHVKNFRRAECYPDGPFLSWPTALADGDIDYRLAVAMALEGGYHGPICIEHYGGDGLAAQRAGLGYLRSLLEL